MGLIITYDDGQTPLDDDEREGLLIKSLNTRQQLDEFEQQNIEQALLWTLRRKRKAEDILDETFIKELHRRMYGDVWKWAGEFRKTNKNIGVDKWQIGIELKALLDDCRYWISNRVFAEDEIAIRFKHRLVSIHCFPNGNGRHSRLAADVLSDHVFKQPVFTWGAANLLKSGKERENYLKAVRLADRGLFDDLIKFARS